MYNAVYEKYNYIRLNASNSSHKLLIYWTKYDKNFLKIPYYNPFLQKKFYFNPLLCRFERISLNKLNYENKLNIICSVK